MADGRRVLLKLRRSGSCVRAWCVRVCRHDQNEYSAALRAHVDERDALLARTDRARQRLALLRNTNVFNDAFKIW